MKKCPYCGKEYPDGVSVCAIDQEPLEANTPPADKASAPATEDSENQTEPDNDRDVPEGYAFLGSFEPFEAARVLRRFEQEGIRFLIDGIEASIATGRGMRKQALIEIDVRLDDVKKAGMILAEDSKL